MGVLPHLEALVYAQEEEGVLGICSILKLVSHVEKLSHLFVALINHFSLAFVHWD